MLIVRLLPTIFSTLIVTAHIMRFYGLEAAILVLLLLATLFIRNLWTLKFWQILHGVFVVMWINVSIDFIQTRMAFNTPWVRLALIMAVVTLFTVFSGFWLENKKIKLAYNHKNNEN